MATTVSLGQHAANIDTAVETALERDEIDPAQAARVRALVAMMLAGFSAARIEDRIKDAGEFGSSVTVAVAEFLAQIACGPRATDLDVWLRHLRTKANVLAAVPSGAELTGIVEFLPTAGRALAAAERDESVPVLAPDIVAAAADTLLCCKRGLLDPATIQMRSYRVEDGDQHSISTDDVTALKSEISDLHPDLAPKSWPQLVLAAENCASRLFRLQLEREDDLYLDEQAEHTIATLRRALPSPRQPRHVRLFAELALLECGWALPGIGIRAANAEQFIPELCRLAVQELDRTRSGPPEGEDWERWALVTRQRHETICNALRASPFAVDGPVTPAMMTAGTDVSERFKRDYALMLETTQTIRGAAERAADLFALLRTSELAQPPERAPASMSGPTIVKATESTEEPTPPPTSGIDPGAMAGL
ncbi:hypothetical protein ACIGO9_30545 [Nocardia asteroides]|uniref:hypothetical protein n=1 Tax=Nocardia asteroides TaxID=1824 RepID=UPI0037CC2BF8